MVNGTVHKTHLYDPLSTPLGDRHDLAGGMVKPALMEGVMQIPTSVAECEEFGWCPVTFWGDKFYIPRNSSFGESYGTSVYSVSAGAIVSYYISR